MHNIYTYVTKKKRFSLAIYISILLVLTATIPLIVTVGSLALFLRPALIAQTSTSLESNTQAQVQLIDAYLAERLSDINILSKSTALKALLEGKKKPQAAVEDTLTTVQHRDVTNYINISVIDLRGNVAFFYPAAPSTHGDYLIVPEALQQLQKSGQAFVSNVFYDSAGNVPSVDLYARVTDENFHIVGYVRASLGLRRIWSLVDATPAGRSSFILDQNGVRIAYSNSDVSGFTHSHYLFKSVAPISATLHQQIASENLYGNSSTAVTPLVDTALAKIQQRTQSSSTIERMQVQQMGGFEIANYHSSVVPWTYFTLVPLNSITGNTDQQLLISTLIGVGILIFVIVFGLFVGHYMARPILRSVSLLHKNSESLKALAEEENVMATEQKWMVEASQTALDLVRYYTKATDMAVQRIQNIGEGLLQNQQHLSAPKLNKSLKDILEAATYINQATKHQETMNDKLQTSLRVTTQTGDQLTHGANSTHEAAVQIETIVEKLTAVIGE